MRVEFLAVVIASPTSSGMCNCVILWVGAVPPF